MNKNLHSLSERRERKENRSIRSIFSKGKKRRKEEIEIEPKKTKSDEITLKACNVDASLSSTVTKRPINGKNEQQTE